MTIEPDPFQPSGNTSQPDPQTDPTGAASEWSQALTDPKVRSSLLSFGLQLMQPPGFGQTGLGQIAQGIGAAGQTLDAQDVEDRADRELARKERDTASTIDYRADTTDVKQGQLSVAQARAETGRVTAESQAQLRQSQILVNQSKVDQLDANVRMLDMRVKLYPQDMEAKTELARSKAALAEAQTGLAVARAGVVAPTAAAKIEKDQSQTTLNTTRAGAVGTNANIAQRRLDIAEKKPGLQEKIDAQRGERQLIGIYQQAKKENDRARFLDRNVAPIASFQEWKKTNGLPSQGAEPATTPPVTPGAPAPPVAGPDSQLPAFDPAKAATTPPGRYMTPRGALYWNGSGFTTGAQ